MKITKLNHRPKPMIIDPNKFDDQNVTNSANNFNPKQQKSSEILCFPSTEPLHCLMFFGKSNTSTPNVNAHLPRTIWLLTGTGASWHALTLAPLLTPTRRISRDRHGVCDDTLHERTVRMYSSRASQGQSGSLRRHW